MQKTVVNKEDAMSVLKHSFKRLSYKKLVYLKKMLDKRVMILKQHQDIIKKIKFEQSKKDLSKKEKRNQL